jgi:D-ribulokinase
VTDAVWLGIDVGTQSVRCLAADAAGAVVAAASSPLRSHRDGPRHEQDPNDWWAALTDACRQVMSTVDAPVAAVALCATSGTILLTDAAGEPRTPGLMYDDTRAVEEAARAEAAGAALWRTLGYRVQPSWALPKLMWLLANTSGGVPRHQADFLTGRLVGTPTAVDSSHALKTGYDTDAERWPTEVFAPLGVDVAVLPEVVRPGTPLGTVAAASATGIPAGTPVLAGMTDGCAALLGAGSVAVGSWNSVLGTTLVLKGVTAGRVRDPLGAVYSHRAPDGTWLPGGASSVGAGALAGFDITALDALAADRPHTTVVTYPLVSAGERFPFVAPDAVALTVGEPRDEVDRYAAVLRGVAFVERLCFDYLDLLGAPVDGPLTLTGGGARNDHWSQLRADTLRRPATVPADADPAAGMALLARAAGGSLADAVPKRESRTFEPNTRDDDVLTAGYLGLVDTLHARGWLPADLAAHAHERSTR